MKWAVLLFPILALLSACGEQAFFEEHVDLKGQVWRYEDTLLFEVEITDTTQPYDITAIVRYSKQYPYRNLILRSRTLYPTDTSYERTLDITLQTPNGKWMGDCSGDVCELEVPLQRKALFPFIGFYSVKFEQFMRVGDLGGILSFGFRLTESEPNTAS